MPAARSATSAVTATRNTTPEEPAEVRGGGSAPLTPPKQRRRGRTAGPSVPLGSLTQREHQAERHCLNCGSTRVTRLAMNLTDGTPVEFTSCHRCEHRTWAHEGAPLSVDTVLDRTRKD